MNPLVGDYIDLKFLIRNGFRRLQSCTWEGLDGIVWTLEYQLGTGSGSEMSQVFKVTGTDYDEYHYLDLTPYHRALADFRRAARALVPLASPREMIRETIHAWVYANLGHGARRKAFKILPYVSQDPDKSIWKHHIEDFLEAGS